MFKKVADIEEILTRFTPPNTNIYVYTFMKDKKLNLIQEYYKSDG